MDDAKNKTSLKARIQKLGTALSGMVMPNIAAIIAWGLITAIFMAEGWFPNKQIAELIGPMLNYLLPLLIGYVGGRMVYEKRGAVVGAIATIGIVVGSQVPMFLGAMIMGPACLTVVIAEPIFSMIPKASCPLFSEWAALSSP